MVQRAVVCFLASANNGTGNTDAGEEFTMSNTEDGGSGSPDCSLVWVTAEVAETWPAGCKVLIRRTSGDGVTRHVADDWHRPDWVRGKLRSTWKSVEWAMIEMVK